MHCHIIRVSKVESDCLKKAFDKNLHKMEMVYVKVGERIGVIA